MTQNEERALTRVETRAPANLVETLMDVKDLSKAVRYVEDVKKDVMHADVDYGIIPGTKKPTLLKPGMERLCLAFQASPEYDIIDGTEEHDKEWKWKDGNDEEKTSVGFYFYKVRCKLTSRVTGTVLSSALGLCSSRERGKETAPPNTILKMAEKRAFGLAVQNAFAVSHLFDVDLDDMDESEIKSGKKKEAALPGAVPGAVFIMKDAVSKYPCKCCGEKHVKDTKMIKTEDFGWVSEDCYINFLDAKKKKAEDDGGDDTLPFDDPPPPGDNDAPGNI